jgi:hypothetical protein
MPPGELGVTPDDAHRREQMAAFGALDWRRIDVAAIVTFSGLATVDEGRHQACRDWLLREGYEVDTFDCRPGLTVAVPELGRRLRWQEQFGYALGPESRNLNALRDGFDFAIPEGGGRVFEVIRPDLAWEEDWRWLCGLLAIAQEHCRQQLALGRRFFALLVVPEQSPLIGAVVEEVRVPHVYHNPCRELHEFAR